MCVSIEDGGLFLFLEGAHHMQMKVLLATGHEDLNRILRNNFRRHEKKNSFKILEHDVVHQRYLQEIVRETQPDIIIFHDYHLHSQFTDSSEREKEWIEQIESLRRDYDDKIRFVFICERSRHDPFLGELVTANVLDIYRTREIDLSILIESLLEPPKYSKVAAYKDNLSPKERPTEWDIGDESEGDSIKSEHETLPVENDNEAQLESVSENEEGKESLSEPIKEKGTLIQLPKISLDKLKLPKREKKEKPPKIVEQKIINKQVIKREFKLNINQTIEKLVGFSLSRHLVLVGSPFPRAGSTFFCHMLAKEIANCGVGVSYIENPFKPSYTYDRFYGHRYMENYTSLFYAFSGKEQDEKSLFSVYDVETSEQQTHIWEHESVRLIVQNPMIEKEYTEKEVDLYVFAKLILSLQKTPIVIVDVGTDWNSEVMQELTTLADHVFLLLEPDIPNIEYYEGSSEPAMKFIRSLAEQEKTHLIGNRFTEDIRKQLIDHEIPLIPAFPSKDIFEQHYKGTMSFMSRTLEKDVQKVFQPIVEMLIPREYLRKKQKGRFSLGSIIPQKFNIQNKS